jgi:hypothetical protein
VYGYYERIEQLLDNVERDAPLMPVVAEINTYRVRYLEQVAELLASAWPARGQARRRVRQAIGHALEFTTWRSLARDQGCTTREAVRLMVALAGAAAGGAPRR